MTDADKREKVIRGFECCLRNDHKKCPYYSADIMDTTCYTRLHTDALALLKEQEARVLTRREVTQYLGVASNGFQAADIDEPPLWVEYRNHKRHGWVFFGTVYSWMNDRETSVDYGKEFRFWTSRPTPEQRKAVKWDG